METQTDLAKTVVDLARLDHRPNNTKAENSRSHKTQSSVRKQASSFAAVQKRKPRTVHYLLTTKMRSTLIRSKITAVKLSLIENGANNAKVESSNVCIAKLLLQARSFIRCRKGRQGEGHC